MHDWRLKRPCTAAWGVCALALFWTEARAADSAQIQVRDFMFMPATLTVSAGAQVTWVNKDDEPHTVVSDSGVFRSPAMDTNEGFSFKFGKPGTYRFICSIHPYMAGSIIVQ